MAKLLFIHHSGLIGGAGVSLCNNLKTLSKAGHEVVLYAPSDPPSLMELLWQEYPKVQLKTYGRRIGAITYYSGGDSVFSLRFWYRLTLILKQWRYWNHTIERENPDIVAMNSTILCWMSMLAAVRRRKSVCFVRETKVGSANNLLNRIIHWLLEHFTHVVFISQYDQQREALTTAASTVICDYVDADKLDNTLRRHDAERRLGLQPGVFRALYVGGVSPMKGFDLAVEAVLKCKQPVELLVAGMGFEEAQKVASKSLRDYAIRMQNELAGDTSGRIVMLGVQKDMSACYAACDVLLFPMRSPHQARPAFEAGYFGKPFIISDFENIREFVVDGENGYVVPPENAVAIAEKLDDLATHPEKARQLGEANCCRCLQNHAGKTNCQAVRTLLEGLVSA